MITNSKAKRILCFGDSNTWGYIPGTDHKRQPPDIRWTGALQKSLGKDFEIIEEGLNSRGIASDDSRPGKEGRSALEYIIPCLDTHDPLDLVIVMLGTNEFKNEYSLEPGQITRSMKELLEIIKERKSQFEKLNPELILISPPFVNEGTEYCQEDNKYKGASNKSEALSGAYKRLSEELNIEFFDASSVAYPGITDGVHLPAEEHKKLAEAIETKVRKIFS